MNLFQICIFAVCGLIFSVILKSINSTYSIWMIAAVIIVAGALAVVKMGSVITQLKSLLDFASVNQNYISLLFKIIGITYITHFTAAMFKDHGYSAAADILEVLCRISVAQLSLPIVLSLFETVARCI